MKPAELRELKIDELTSKTKELKEELFNLKFQLSLGQLQDTAQIKKIRRDIARIKTIIREKETAQV